MIISIEQLKEKYKEYSDINGKIAREMKCGNLISIVKGLYETDKNVDPIYLCQYICSPSYISFDTALAIYGLIPERTYKYTCASFKKRKRKIYKNYFSDYIFSDIPESVFYLDVNYKEEDGYIYHIATAEKALCDKLYSLSPVKSMKEFKYLLFDDLRIDKESFSKLDKEELIYLGKRYHSTNLNYLIKLIEAEENNESNNKSNVI